jgi:hypothetical protein
MLKFIPLLLTALLGWTAPAWATITVAAAVTAASSGASTSTTIAAPAITLTAGQGVEICTKWEGNFTVTGMASDKGDTVVLQNAQQHSALEPSGRCAHVISAVGGSTVFTTTFSGAAPYRRIHVFPITYTGTLALDVQSAASTESTTLDPASAAVTTTGTDEVCFGFQADYTTQAFSNENINGVAADGRSTQSDSNLFYRILTNTMTGAAGLHRTVPERWIMRLACLKATGGGAPPPPPAATGTIRFVSTTGSDSNSCAASTNIATPKLTLASAIACMVAGNGDVLYMRGGTYTQSINATNVPNGTSWTNAAMIAGYAGEIVTLRPSSGAIISLGSPLTHYQIYKDFIVDAVNLPVAGGGIASEDAISFGSEGSTIHHIRMQNLEVKNAPGHAIGVRGSFHEFLNLTCHANGLADTTKSVPYDRGGNCLYVVASNTLVSGGRFYDNTCYAIRFGGSGAVVGNDNLVTHVHAVNNGRNHAFNNTGICSSGGGGITLSNRNNVASHNVVDHNWHGIDTFTGGLGVVTGMALYNNTVTANDIGIQIVSSIVSGAILTDNHSAGNTAGLNFLDGGTGTILNTNRFTGAITDCTVSASDFTQKAGSSCISGSNTIISGLAFNGPRPEQGAHEMFSYVSATINQNLLDVSVGMNLNTPMLPAAGMTGFTVACTGSGCPGTPTVLSANRLTGADSVARLTVNWTCAVGQTVTVTYSGTGNVTDSALIGTVNQPMSAFTSAAVTNACGTPPPPPPAGVTISYDFTEGTGITLTDSAGGDQNGTLTNGPAWVTTGKFGPGVAFTDASNQYVAIAYGTGLNPTTSSWTDCMGVDPDTGLEGATRVIFGTANGTNQRMYLATFGGTWTQGVQASGFGLNTEFPVGAGFAYVCQVVDGTADTVTLYVNGVAGKSNQSIKATTSYVLASDFRLGQQGTDPTAGVTFAEFKHFPTALTAANIATLYAIWEPPTPPAVGTFSMSASRFYDAFYQTGTTTVVPLSAISATTTTIHSGIPFALDVQIDCTVADCDPAGVRLSYAIQPLSTGVKSAFLPVPNIAGPDSLSFFGSISSANILQGPLPATCLSGALTPSAGTTNSTMDAIPVFDLPLNGCIVQRYLLQMGPGAVLGDIYWFEPFIQTGQAMSSVTPTGGAKLTVTPVAGMSAPTGLHFVGTTSTTLVQFVWTPVVDPNLAGYIIYYSSVSGGPYTPIGIRTQAYASAYNTPITQFSLQTSTAGQYCFVVQGFNTGNQLSANSGEICVTKTGIAPRTLRTP